MAGTKNNKKAFAGRSGTHFWVDPYDVLVPGVDFTPKGEHPLLDDPDRLKPPQWLIDDIAARGQADAVKVRKNGDTYEVADGRGRTLAVRALVDAGDKDRKLKVEAVKFESDKDAFRFMLAANSMRRDYTPIQKARNALRAKNAYGMSPEEIAAASNVGVEAVRQWLAFFDCSDDVQKLVAAGEADFSVAPVLARLTREEQLPAFEKLKAEGKVTVAKARVEVHNRKAERRATSNGATAEPRAQRLGQRVVEKIYDDHMRRWKDESETLFSDDFVNGMRVAMGLLAPERVKGLSGLIKELTAKKAKAPKKSADAES